MKGGKRFIGWKGMLINHVEIDKRGGEAGFRKSAAKEKGEGGLSGKPLDLYIVEGIQGSFELKKRKPSRERIEGERSGTKKAKRKQKYPSRRKTPERENTDGD